MFPITVTLHSADQLDAVLTALGNVSVKKTTCATDSCASHKPAADKPKEESAKKSETTAATATAATQTTAATSAAPESKASESAKPAVLSVEERASIIKNLAGGGKREEVVALLAKYGAKKGSEVKEADLQAFDAELKAL